jgi:hypothetical protein
MSDLTLEELQAQLIANNQAVAANTVALLTSIVDGRMNLHDVDFDDLTAKVTALNDLLDGDADNTGFQTFQSLVNRMTAVETDNIAQASAITALQTLVASQGATINARIDQVENDASSATSALDGRVTTLETNATASAAARMSKDNQHDSAIASLTTTAGNLEDAVTAEATARVAADQVNTAAINAEKARVDALTTQASKFVTRQEIGNDLEAAGQAHINALWAGRTRPAGLANTDGSVSA